MEISRIRLLPDPDFLILHPDLDHTADVQIHSWAPTLLGAFEEAAIGMIGYMTDLDCIEIDEELEPFEATVTCATCLLDDSPKICTTMKISMSRKKHSFFRYFPDAEDLQSLLYDFLTEVLVAFQTEYVIFAEIQITHFDEKKNSITFVGRGERWDDDKHPQGTEVKAITYSAMKVIPPKDDKRAEIYVIVDI